MIDAAAHRNPRQDAGGLPTGRAAPWARKLATEPLLHFLLIGSALFGLQAWRGAPVAAPGSASTAATVVVTRADVERLESLFAKTWQRPPTEAERAGLVEDHVRNEIYFREALALGLERDDDVLRRRLRQKLEFLYEDVASLTEPSDDELGRFLHDHPDRYRIEPRIAFHQVFVRANASRPQAEEAARRVLGELERGADPRSLGDPTLLSPDVPSTARSEIARQFGDRFAAALDAVPPERWSGPVASTFGWHLVRVDERIDGRAPTLDEVREAVRRDWMVAKQQALKDADYARLRQRYTVTVESAGADAAAGRDDAASGTG